MPEADRDEEIAEWERRVQVLTDELAQARAENLCDACGGEEANRQEGPCMCQGTGKMSEAAAFLRSRLVRALSDREQFAYVLCRLGDAVELARRSP